MFNNKTLDNYNLYYGLKSKETLKAIADTHTLKEIYTKEKFEIVNTIQVTVPK